MILPVFLLMEATSNMDEPEAFLDYTSRAKSIIRDYGGIVIATYDVEYVLDGSEGPTVFVVISFLLKRLLLFGLYSL